MADHISDTGQAMLALSRLLVERNAALRELDAICALLCEVAASGVEAETRQYVLVQIDPETWKKIQEVARG